MERVSETIVDEWLDLRDGDSLLDCWLDGCVLDLPREGPVRLRLEGTVFSHCQTRIGGEECSLAEWIHRRTET